MGKGERAKPSRWNACYPEGGDLGKKATRGKNGVKVQEETGLALRSIGRLTKKQLRSRHAADDGTNEKWGDKGKPWPLGDFPLFASPKRKPGKNGTYWGGLGRWVKGGTRGGGECSRLIYGVGTKAKPAV